MTTMLIATISAVLIAMIAVLALGATIHIGTVRSKSMFPVLFAIITFAFTLAILFSGRVLSSNMDEFYSGMQGMPGQIWFNRITSLVILAISVERIFRYVFVKTSRYTSQGYLLWAFVAFVLGNVILNGFFGTRPEFSHRSIYLVIVMLAAFTIAQTDVVRIIHVVKVSLLSFLILSAIMLVIKPSLVLQPNYIGILPIIHFRYWGLSSHANTMGPITIVFILCLWVMPFKQILLNRFAWVLSVLSLLMTQSKTSLGLAMVCGVIVGFIWIQSIPRISDVRRKSIVFFTLLIPTLIAFSGLCILLMVVDVSFVLDSFLATDKGADLLSFTGRDKIWEIAIREWHNNIWFGYGPKMWDLAYRLQIGLTYAFNAHNQFFQALGSAGVLGVFTFLLYVVALIVAAFKSAKASKGLSLALLALMLIRSVTEVPFALNDLLGMDFFIQLLTFVVCAGYANKLNTSQLDNSKQVALGNQGVAN